jgi:hypothetical protein
MPTLINFDSDWQSSSLKMKKQFFRVKQLADQRFSRSVCYVVFLYMHVHVFQSACVENFCDSSGFIGASRYVRHWLLCEVYLKLIRLSKYIFVICGEWKIVADKLEFYSMSWVIHCCLVLLRTMNSMEQSSSLKFVLQCILSDHTVEGGV